MCVQGVRGYIYVVLQSTLQQEVITQLFWNKPPLPCQVQIENDEFVLYKLILKLHDYYGPGNFHFIHLNEKTLVYL